ncbi:MAG: hypothetical protein EAX96_16910, partial [Candidatus Lokiarchaeota archaeon]|nr:hypothetical protein [Candidatus Lokiarchaeota archaeon]
DGQGRYVFWKLLNRRIIIPKEVLDVDIPDIRLHDKDNLPFVVKISCKVQVKEPIRAAETLGNNVYEGLRRIVDDTVQSSARTTCMQKEILAIMREREDIEDSIYSSLTKSFMKLGLEPIIFDIKDIEDAEGSSVIKNLERVKSAELTKTARIAEATQYSLAQKVEAEKHKDARVVEEQMAQAEKEAEIEKEKFVADQTEELVTKRMRIKELEIKRAAEIEREKEIVLANAKAEAVRIAAEGDAKAVQLKAEAEAAGIRAKALALEEYKKAGEQGFKMKSLELLVDGMIQSSKEMAVGMKDNSKIIMMGGQGNSGSGSITSLIPFVEILKETGIIKDIVGEVEEARKSK